MPVSAAVAVTPSAKLATTEALNGPSAVGVNARSTAHRAPAASVPAWIPVIFELTILLSAFGAVGGMLLLNGVVFLVNALAGLLLLVLLSGVPLWAFSIIVTVFASLVVPYASIGTVLLYGDALARRHEIDAAGGNPLRCPDVHDLQGVPGVGDIFFDITHKPPGTIEWE